MTEAEIMKAWECCIEKRDLKQCNNYDCPLQYKTSTFAECKKMLVESVLDLINRKNAENEKLNFENLQMIASIKGLKAEAIKDVLQRARGKVCCIPQHHFTLEQVLCDIDQIAKEMGVEL